MSSLSNLIFTLSTFTPELSINSPLIIGFLFSPTLEFSLGKTFLTSGPLKSSSTT